MAETILYVSHGLYSGPQAAIVINVVLLLRISGDKYVGYKKVSTITILDNSVYCHAILISEAISQVFFPLSFVFSFYFSPGYGSPLVPFLIDIYTFTD